MRVQRILIPVGLAIGAALLYLPQLSDASYYLGRDEMFFGLQAHSLATTGRDTNGLILPLYIQSPMRYGSEMWFQPMLMYSGAASVKVFGLSEGSIRLPMTLFAIIDIVLIYFIGRRLFHRELPAIAAAVLLAFTPAHYIHGRVAMDFQAPLPFMLAWLLCILTYLEVRKPAWLFGAGLSLGIGLYTYIASYMLMPVYAMLTGVVLLQRRESAPRYVLLAAGVLIPALCAIPFLVTHPTVVRDILWHYDRTQPQGQAAGDLFVQYFGFQRFLDAAVVYARFWSPRFLFINGPNTLWVAGALLLPTAGLLLAGLVRLLRAFSPVTILLVGGLLTAPIPASLVGDIDAVHRASNVLPFGVLIAIVGLDTLWSEDRPWARGLAFVATFAVAIGLATVFHAQLPFAQALNRAATVPLIVAGLAALWAAFPASADVARLSLVAAVVIAVLQVSYYVLGYSLTGWMSSAALAAAAITMLRSNSETMSSQRQALIVATLAAACSHFMFAYPDYSYVQRVLGIPASAILLAVRACYTAAAVAALAAVAWAVRGGAPAGAHRWRDMLVIAATLLAVQFGYFHIDYFSDHRLRLLQTVLVLATAGLAAARLSRHATMSRMQLLAATLLFGLAALQFHHFYGDYFTRYRDRAGHFDTEGNARVAWERIITTAREREIPALYVAQVGPYGFADLYWEFYAHKYHREDLLQRTTTETMFSRERVRQLPAASLVVTSPSPQLNDTIDRMLADGEISSKTLLTAPDGFSRFWVLETGFRH